MYDDYAYYMNCYPGDDSYSLSIDLYSGRCEYSPYYGRAFLDEGPRCAVDDNGVYYKSYCINNQPNANTQVTVTD